MNKITYIFVILYLIVATCNAYSCKHCQAMSHLVCNRNNYRLTSGEYACESNYFNEDLHDHEYFYIPYQGIYLSCYHNNGNKWNCETADIDSDTETDTDTESYFIEHSNGAICSVNTIEVSKRQLCCVDIRGSCHDTIVVAETITTTTTTAVAELALSPALLAILVPSILAVAVLIIGIVIAIIVCCKLQNKQTNKESSGELEGNVNANPNVNLDSTSRTNTTRTYQEIEYYSVNRGNETEPEPTTVPDSLPINSPEYVMIRNELYAGFVEGEVSDVNIYEELDQLKYQNSIYSITNNSVYNVRYNRVSRKTNRFIEPPASLPELESDLKCCPFEIKREELEIGEQFASGHFGIVYRATYHTERGDIPVAVKTLKESATSDTMVSFMREAATLSQFSHPNVLRLIGVVTLQQPLMIVTELLKTELRELLIKLSGLPQDDVLPHLLFKFSQEIAAGMEYLSGINFIHRDLAARNVLVAKDMTIRVADFGMSREVISESNYYTSSGGTVPLRWTAPEAVLHKKFSEKSDVWSYGMTLYEIWSLGERPWGDSTNEEIVTALTIGHSPLTPSDCPQALCAVMQECWRSDKADRPTFSQLISLLRGISLPVPPHN